MAILDLFFPKICLGCSKEGKYLCSQCIAQVPVLKPVCPGCEKFSFNGLTHLECKKECELEGLTSVWDFEGIIRKAILALKFKYSTLVGSELSQIFVNFLQNNSYSLPKEGVLIPIPLHWHRHNVRGFNQSQEMGHFVAEKMGWEFAPDLLIKKKSTVSQVELSVNKRKENLKDAFSVNPPYLSRDSFKQSSLILFDDVFTTGSTLKEAAQTLKTIGVQKVWGLTISR